MDKPKFKIGEKVGVFAGTGVGTVADGPFIDAKWVSSDGGTVKLGGYSYVVALDYGSHLVPEPELYRIEEWEKVEGEYRWSYEHNSWERRVE